MQPQFNFYQHDRPTIYTMLEISKHFFCILHKMYFIQLLIKIIKLLAILYKQYLFQATMIDLEKELIFIFMYSNHFLLKVIISDIYEKQNDV